MDEIVKREGTVGDVGRAGGGAIQERGALEPSHMGHDDRRNGAPAPGIDEIQPIDDDYIEIIDDLGNDLDDTDALISEREGYWQGIAPAPTRKAYLLHRIAECVEFLRALSPSEAPPWPIYRIPEEVWLAAARTVFPDAEPVPNGVQGDALGAKFDGLPVSATATESGEPPAQSKTALLADFANTARRQARPADSPSERDAMGHGLATGPIAP